MRNSKSENDDTKPERFENKGKSNGRSRKRGNSTTTQRKDQQAKSRNLPIPSGMGIGIPRFRETLLTDEDCFVPLCIFHGRFTVFGHSATSPFSINGESYAQKLRTELKMAGYNVSDIAPSDIRTYFDNVAILYQMHQFLFDIRTLANNTDTHTAISIRAFTDNVITGKLIARHRHLVKLLSVLPTLPQLYNTLKAGFSPTLMSDNPNSPLRMFAPYALMPEEGENNGVYTSAAIIDTIDSFRDAFFADATVKRLLEILPQSGMKLEEFSSSPVTYQNNTVNNILNLPYFDGLIYNPTGDVDQRKPLFFRRSLDAMGCLTFAPQAGETADDTGTVWEVWPGGAASTSMHRYVTDIGESYNIYSSSGAYHNSGLIHEGSVGLNASVNPSVTKVSGDPLQIANGLSDLIHN
jgi:hypothetical protein